MDMKIVCFIGLSGIMAHSAPSTFAFLKTMSLEVHETTPLLNTIHLRPTVQVLSTEIAQYAC